MGDLNFYDSISGVLDWLGPATGKRALVLLTTGLDSSAPARWDALVRKLRSEDVVIFAVALGGSLRGDNTKKTKMKKNGSKSARAPRLRRTVSRKPIRPCDRWRKSPAAARIFRSPSRISFPSITKSLPRCGINTCSESRRSTTESFTR